MTNPYYGYYTEEEYNRAIDSLGMQDQFPEPIKRYIEVKEDN